MTGSYVPAVGWDNFTDMCLRVFAADDPRRADAAVVLAECRRCGRNPVRMYDEFCYWHQVTYFPNWWEGSDAKDWEAFRMFVCNELGASKEKADA